MDIKYKDILNKIIKDNNLNIEIKNDFIRKDSKCKELAIICVLHEVFMLKHAIEKLFEQDKNKFQELLDLFNNNLHRATRKGLFHWY